MRLAPERLTELLRSGGILRDARVVAIEREPIGTFSSQVDRLRVRYDRAEPGAPTCIVHKHRKPGAPPEGTGEGFETEIRFYRDLSHELSRDAGLAMPRFCFGAPGADASLGLEEVEGLLPVHFLRGVEPDHAERAAAALARLHADRWGRVDALDAFPSLADAAFRAGIGADYERSWAASRDYFLWREADAFVEIGDALVGRVADSLEPLGTPATLLHGDAHSENLPLSEADRRVVFLDWAAVRRGHAAFDVAVFAVQRADYRRGVLYWMVHMLQQARLRPGDAPWIVIDRYIAAAVELQVGELIG